MDAASSKILLASVTLLLCGYFTLDVFLYIICLLGVQSMAYTSLST